MFQEWLVTRVIIAFQPERVPGVQRSCSGSQPQRTRHEHSRGGGQDLLRHPQRHAAKLHTGGVQRYSKCVCAFLGGRGVGEGVFCGGLDVGCLH